jgi:hypothetical protein
MCGYNRRQVAISEEEWELGFQDNCSANLDKIREVLKIKVHACTELNDAIRQLKNWHLLLAILFGTHSASALTVQKLVKRLEKREMFMAEQAHNNPLMMPGFLQCVYNIFHEYFYECSLCKSNEVPPRINISLVWEQLKVGYNFNTIALCTPVKRALQQPTHNHNNDSNKQGKHKHNTNNTPDDSSPSEKTKKRKSRKDEAKKVRSDPTHPGYNKWFNKKLFTDDTQFAKVFPKRSSLPTFNGTDTTMCMAFHLRGGCRQGDSCARASTHKKLNPDTEKALQDWRESALK